MTPPTYKDHERAMAVRWKHFDRIVASHRYDEYPEYKQLTSTNRIGRYLIASRFCDRTSLHVVETRRQASEFIFNYTKYFDYTSFISPGIEIHDLDTDRLMPFEIKRIIRWAPGLAKKYQPELLPKGGDTLCRCGHTYERHFDGYAGMAPVGCKYCSPEEDHHVPGKYCPEFMESCSP